MFNTSFDARSNELTNQSGNVFDETQIENIEELGGTEVKINPNFYIHRALIRAQQSLVKENAFQGFLQFRMVVEHLGVLCEAAGITTEDELKAEIFKWKTEDEEYLSSENSTKPILYANKKFGILARMIFENATVNFKLSDSPKPMRKTNYLTEKDIAIEPVVAVAADDKVASV
jgi:hypothetical protein